MALKSLHWRLAAFAWSIAEATLFFIVPDVLLTLLAVRRGSEIALRAALWAAAGAVLGGGVMLAWAHADAAGAERVLDMLPAIDAGLIARVKWAVAEAWFPALMNGAFSGVPYKVYAVEAGGQGIAAIPFLVMTFFARLARFVLSSVLAHGIASLLRCFGWGRLAMPVWALWWLGFYAVYWTVTP